MTSAPARSRRLLLLVALAVVAGSCGDPVAVADPSSPVAIAERLRAAGIDCTDYSEYAYFPGDGEPSTRDGACGVGELEVTISVHADSDDVARLADIIDEHGEFYRDEGIDSVAWVAGDGFSVHVRTLDSTAFTSEPTSAELALLEAIGEAVDGEVSTHSLD